MERILSVLAAVCLMACMAEPAGVWAEARPGVAVSAAERKSGSGESTATVKIKLDSTEEHGTGSSDGKPDDSGGKPDEEKPDNGSKDGKPDDGGNDGRPGDGSKDDKPDGGSGGEDGKPDKGESSGDGRPGNGAGGSIDRPDDGGNDKKPGSGSTAGDGSANGPGNGGSGAAGGGSQGGAGDAGNKETGTLRVLNAAAGSGEKLSGAVFAAYSGTGRQAGTLTVQDGEAGLALAPGDYYLLERKAPAGYLAETSRIPFSISAGRTTTVEITSEKDADGTGIWADIPKTGERPPYLRHALSALCLAAAAASGIAYLRTGKKQWHITHKGKEPFQCS